MNEYTLENRFLLLIEKMVPQQPPPSSVVPYSFPPITLKPASGSEPSIPENRWTTFSVPDGVIEKTMPQPSQLPPPEVTPYNFPSNGTNSPYG